MNLLLRISALPCFRWADSWIFFPFLHHIHYTKHWDCADSVVFSIIVLRDSSSMKQNNLLIKKNYTYRLCSKQYVTIIILLAVQCNPFCSHSNSVYAKELHGTKLTKIIHVMQRIVDESNPCTQSSSSFCSKSYTHIQCWVVITRLLNFPTRKTHTKFLHVKTISDRVVRYLLA